MIRTGSDYTRTFLTKFFRAGLDCTRTFRTNVGVKLTALTIFKVFNYI
jgi:hypothetical protein